VHPAETGETEHNFRRKLGSNETALDHEIYFSALGVFENYTGSSPFNRMVTGTE
jgi:hypothetical protein